MNISLILDMACDGFGDRVVLGSRSAGLTPLALRRMTAAGAATIRREGGDSVVYLAQNGPAFAATMFAAAAAGVPVVPLNYRLGDDQLEALLSNHPGAFAIADPEQLPRLRSLGLRGRTTDTWMEEMRSAGGAHDGDPEPADGEGPAVLIYTSGTTSAPKGVVIRHSHLMSYVMSSVDFASAEADQTALISVPPYHIAAVANTVTNLYAGRRCVILRQFDAARWLQVAREEEITNALVVPTMLARIMEEPAESVKVPTLRAVAYGGAAMPTPVVERALRAWPDVAFVNAYGLTETSSTIAVLGPEDHRAALAGDDPAVRSRLSSAGKVLPSIELRIRDDDGAELPGGAVGRIWVRGDQVSGEYAGTGSVLDADGFFDTRDRGWVDEEGFLFIEGRADDTIIRGGENVAPAEIETVLLDHRDVLDAVVVGLPDQEWGQRIEAAVVLRVGSSETSDGLREFVRGRLRGSKTPERIALWDELPRTETGKLIRREAVDRIMAERR